MSDILIWSMPPMLEIFILSSKVILLDQMHPWCSLWDTGLAVGGVLSSLCP